MLSKLRTSLLGALILLALSLAPADAAPESQWYGYYNYYWPSYYTPLIIPDYGAYARWRTMCWTWYC
jgi:hypothetical protein